MEWDIENQKNIVNLTLSTHKVNWSRSESMIGSAIKMIYRDSVQQFKINFDTLFIFVNKTLFSIQLQNKGSHRDLCSQKSLFPSHNIDQTSRIFWMHQIHTLMITKGYFSESITYRTLFFHWLVKYFRCGGFYCILFRQNIGREWLSA